MKNGAYYDYDQNKVSYYKGQNIIATLKIGANEFEEFITMTEGDKDHYYNEMQKEYRACKEAELDSGNYGIYNDNY